MRVVMPVAIPEVIRFRERTGANRFDEMWQGVLHMTPSPSFHHQSHASRILSFFVEVWCPGTGGAAVMQVNVSTQDRWDQDYRIPDISVMRPEHVPRDEAMFVRPTVLFEIRSPGDETYEKLSFYAAVGVEAVVVVERDTKAVQVFALVGGNFLAPPWQTAGPSSPPSMSSCALRRPTGAPRSTSVSAVTVTRAPTWFDPGFYKADQDKQFKHLVRVGSAAAGNAATRIEAFVITGGIRSYGGYPDLDALFRDQSTEMDKKKREALLHKIQQLMYDKAMFAPIVEPALLTGVGPRLAEPPTIAGHPYLSPYEDLKLK